MSGAHTQLEAFRALQRSLGSALDSLHEATVQASLGNNANAAHWLELLQNSLNCSGMDIADLVTLLTTPEPPQDKD